VPSIFLTAAYFYTSFTRLGLTEPAGYRWIRYGPDLVLVNLATGRVEDVAHGVFF
jgi:Ni/Co efflux regulator RcnB